MENIIEKIHHEFKTSYLKNFADANEVVKDGFKINKNYEQAIKLGFTLSPSLKEYQENKVEYNKNLMLLEDIKRYKVDYPYRKFISYKDTADIVFKYGLVISTPNNFKGEFPDKNIKDMIDFNLKKVDVNIFDKNTCDLFKIHNSKIHYNSTPNFIANTLEESIKEIKKNPLHYVFYTSSPFNGRLNPNFIYQPIYRYFSKYHESIKESDFLENNFDEDIKEFTNEGKFVVIGTEDQFNVKSNQQVVNGQIQNKITDDPIILQPVRNGFIIVTVWGDEAKLPEIEDTSLN